MDRDTPSPDPATPPTALWRRAAGIGGRGLLWLPGTLLGALLAGCAALWVWAGTEGSLAQSLAWAQRWQVANAADAGRIEIADVRGNLVSGGAIGRLAWTRDGLRAEADGVQIELGAGFWFAGLRGQLNVSSLQVDTLRISDTRPVRPDEPRVPLESLTLPLPVDANVAIDRVIVEGAQAINLTDLRAR